MNACRCIPNGLKDALKNIVGVEALEQVVPVLDRGKSLWRIDTRKGCFFVKPVLIGKDGTLGGYADVYNRVLGIVRDVGGVKVPRFFGTMNGWVIYEYVDFLGMKVVFKRNRFGTDVWRDLGRRAGRFLGEVHSNFGQDRVCLREVYRREVDRYLGKYGRFLEMRLRQKIEVRLGKLLDGIDVFFSWVGFRHTDFQLNNIGVDADGQLVVVDFDDVSEGVSFKDLGELVFSAVEFLWLNGFWNVRMMRARVGMFLAGVLDEYLSVMRRDGLLDDDKGCLDGVLEVVCILYAIGRIAKAREKGVFRRQFEWFFYVAMLHWFVGAGDGGFLRRWLVLYRG